ncbi:STAS domain-containing protein [Streptomyces sp. CAI-21]|uniref:STAS domain-containing protein n=1 Tax=Streptomyces TaxID=1883 RepID=UPI0015879562|nr:STAS domain-containing protein [Streptomyces sp. FT1]MBO1284502.1 STAS domain-containing protein [Streptomyces sampsonii]MCX5456768.1 STAS domain-containing protein [Streptomyces sp. FT1]NUW05694.1 STAS domain-containing protein [Streptomyces sp. CAI-21]
MLERSGMDITTSAELSAFVIGVHGDVDLHTAPALDAALAQALRTETPRTVVDLSGTGFADSSILGSLLRALRDHRERGRRLILAGPMSDLVTRLFEVTGTLAAFETAPDARAAREQ